MLLFFLPMISVEFKKWLNLFWFPRLIAAVKGPTKAFMTVYRPPNNLTLSLLHQILTQKCALSYE